MDNCPKCNVKNKYLYWCLQCLSQYFQAEFSNWSSGNQIIDKFIQEIQLNATEWAQYLEWIPYERLVNVHYLAKGGFGSVYSATWLDGPKACDRDKIEIFCRKENHPVALKSINHSGPAMEGFFSELNIYIEAMKSFDGYNDLLRYYGITQNPETKEYMMVTQFANQGSLRDSLNKSFGNKMLWKTKLYLLMRISTALITIHQAGLVHRDLHSGNILLDDDDEDSATILAPMTRVSDLGLTCQGKNYMSYEKMSREFLSEVL
ncbi:11249_t:CDS:2 [Entrophospora sp. SA101]|nr:11249_t:CDS:2 [Entrophospora sp. SA101]CAJ0854814.1 1958_t:CDS:2 [Entrophospora sp. SA101]